LKANPPKCIQSIGMVLHAVLLSYLVLDAQTVIFILYEHILLCQESLEIPLLDGNV